MTTRTTTPKTPSDMDELLAELGRWHPEVDWSAMLATPPLEVWTPEDVAYALIDAGCDPDGVRRLFLAA
jgi:hypothetical protein